MKFIDSAGLEGSVPTPIYAKALGIEGYTIPPEERDVLLRSLNLHPPEAGEVMVITGPGGGRYWAGTPTSVRVVMEPGGQEVPASVRQVGIEWVLSKSGAVTASEAKALAAKPPTVKSKHFQTYLAAAQEWMAWELLDAPDGYETLSGRYQFIGDIEPPKGEKPYEYVLVDNARALRNLGLDLEDARNDPHAVIGLDVESDEDENYESALVGLSVAFHARQDDEARAVSYYVPTNGPIGADIIRAFLRLHFLDRESPWFVAHNGKFDCQVFAKYLDPSDPIAILRRLTGKIKGDGLIAAYVNAKVDYANGRPIAKGLKDLAFSHFGVTMLHFMEMLGLSGAKAASQAPLGDIGPYCAADAFWGVKVCEYEEYELRRYPKLQALYERVELPTVRIVAEMEMLGMRLDYELLAKRRREVTARVEVYRRYLEKGALAAGYALKQESHRCKAGHSAKRVEYQECPLCDERGKVTSDIPFNPGSRLQVEAIIQGTFHLPRMASTPSGDASNDEPAMLRLREFTSDEEAKDWITFLLAWRKDDKIRGTYLDGLWERKRRDIWQEEGAWFIHPTYSQAVTTSGRYSSKDPNGQNIPLNQRDLFIA